MFLPKKSSESYILVATDVLYKRNSYGISSQIFGLLSSVLITRRLRLVLDGKLSQKYPVYTGFLQVSILDLPLFLLYINQLPDDVICIIAIYSDDPTLYSFSVMRHLTFGNNSNCLLNLNLIYETLWTRAGSGLLISMLKKLNWFCLAGLITLVLLMWKWMSLLFRKNDLLRCWGWLSLVKWIETVTISLLLKLPRRKLEPWFILRSFFLLRLLCISINLPYSHAWNTVVMSGLVPLVSNWNC